MIVIGMVENLVAVARDVRGRLSYVGNLVPGSHELCFSEDRVASARERRCSCQLAKRTQAAFIEEAQPRQLNGIVNGVEARDGQGRRAGVFQLITTAAATAAALARSVPGCR